MGVFGEVNSNIEDILEEKDEDLVGISDNRIDILQKMAVLTLEHSYNNKSDPDDGTATPPQVLSHNNNVEGSEAYSD